MNQRKCPVERRIKNKSVLVHKYQSVTVKTFRTILII